MEEGKAIPLHTMCVVPLPKTMERLESFLQDESEGEAAKILLRVLQSSDGLKLYDLAKICADEIRINEQNHRGIPINYINLTEQLRKHGYYTVSGGWMDGKAVTADSVLSMPEKAKIFFKTKYQSK